MRKIEVEISEEAFKAFKISARIVAMGEDCTNLLTVMGGKIIDAIQKGDKKVTLKTKQELRNDE